ncbi:MAG: hypothetical protein CMH98_04035 [Oceanospirillaceae bacterium]|nr:hypothetical protein [Oceanospirillaceae bacterium]|tara:strand:- start:2985 stop:3659 length:675 start_codon:yes stop_codon:yes gene_type:complete
MTDIRTDEEQAEALKKWWSDNGKSLVITVLIAGGGFFGWNSWKENQQATGEAASQVFSQLIEQAAQPSAQQTDAVKEEMEALAQTLKTDYASTTYAQFGSLFLARFAADEGDFAAAETELKALIAEAEEGPVKYTAQSRLANVLIQQEKYDEALALVETVPADAYAPQFNEAKGDALYLKGQLAEARAAYISAQTAAQNLGLNTQGLQRKIDNLAAAASADGDA